MTPPAHPTQPPAVQIRYVLFRVLIAATATTAVVVLGTVVGAGWHAFPHEVAIHCRQAGVANADELPPGKRMRKGASRWPVAATHTET